MLRVKLLLLVVTAAAIAAVGASWKWGGHNPLHASAQYKIAGWTWGGNQPDSEQQ